MIATSPRLPLVYAVYEYTGYGFIQALTVKVEFISTGHDGMKVPMAIEIRSILRV